MKFVSILGATGSIGTQTLDVIRKEKDNFKLVGITANSSVKKIIEIIREFKPEHVAMMDEKSAEDVKEFCMENNFNTNIYSGIDGLVKVATVPSATMVVTSVVGMIGLVPTIEAIKKGKDIALANKETLVVAGEIVMKLAKENNVKILPVDSEHGAIFQCLRGNEYKDLKNIILTASGGPFRGKTYDELKHITVKEALNHPNWSMGKKITIDSATLMNKGLEVIEAHFLFNCPYDNIKPIVHKESIVHSMVEYKDGSVIAQLASADMRLPIQYAMNYPKREKAVAKTIDFYEISKLTFEKPDYDTFKCLRLAFEAGKKAGLMPTILNGANEVAVDLFLKEKIKFLDIADIIEDAMNYFEKESKEELTIDNIISLDKKVRKYVLEKFS
ncbi:MAG: 1-deoxy-D-xylulose-5-phosphate reductoisomerase [Clostridiales bacterium]|nr:1-deoxy-D-xylulose-5-phosphate reductoisomerase [Clostridiales bacterium]